MDYEINLDLFLSIQIVRGFVRLEGSPLVLDERMREAVLPRKHIFCQVSYASCDIFWIGVSFHSCGRPMGIVSGVDLVQVVYERWSVSE